MSGTRQRRQITPKAKRTFLEAVGSGWTVTHAAERAGFSRQRFYELREDESFATAWDEALDRGTQVLEDELHRRAIEGWDEDSFDGDGKLIRRVRRYSPALLIFSLKARNPDKYRDNAQVQLTGADGGPVQLAPPDGYAPPTFADVVKLAAKLGVLTNLGYTRADEIEGDAVETPLELEPAA